MLKTLSSKITTVAIAMTTAFVSSLPLVVQADPSMDGKYTDLIQVIDCKTALDEYGSFNDWGYWEGGEVCNDYGAAGYWVYEYPNWYVWATNSDLPDDELPAIASAYGQYYGLIQVVTCESDWENQGDFNDYGYWEGGQVCAEYGLPGYWVYVYPNWYVWEYADD